LKEKRERERRKDLLKRKIQLTSPAKYQSHSASSSCTLHSSSILSFSSLSNVAGNFVSKRHCGSST
jgi:hypothetical protein